MCVTVSNFRKESFVSYLVRVSVGWILFREHQYLLYLVPVIPLLLTVTVSYCNTDGLYCAPFQRSAALASGDVTILLFLPTAREPFCFFVSCRVSCPCGCVHHAKKGNLLTPPSNSTHRQKSRCMFWPLEVPVVVTTQNANRHQLRVQGTGLKKNLVFCIFMLASRPTCSCTSQSSPSDAFTFTVLTISYPSRLFTFSRSLPLSSPFKNTPTQLDGRSLRRRQGRQEQQQQQQR